MNIKFKKMPLYSAAIAMLTSTLCIARQEFNSSLFEENSLLLNNRVANIDHDKRANYCADFIYAHQYCIEPVFNREASVRVAKFLVDTLEYIDSESLFEKVSQGLEEEFKRIGEAPLVVIIDKKKSSEWLTFQMLPKFENKDVHFLESSNVLDYIKNHPEIKHVFRIDDSIYSGEQFKGYTRTFEYYTKELDLHWIVPYFSESGLMNILNTTDKGWFFEPVRLFINTSQTILSIRDKAKLWAEDHQVSEEQLLEELRLSRDRSEFDKYLGMSNTFFQHKVPDNYSSIDSFTRFGKVACVPRRMNGFQRMKFISNLTEVEFLNYNPDLNFETMELVHPPTMEGIPCVPYIAPPYKKENDYTNLEYRCQQAENKESSDCLMYIERLSNLRKARLQSEAP